MYSIYGRLLRADIIKVWKIYNEDLDPDLQKLFERALHPATRGHQLKLAVPRCRKEIYNRFLSVRCVNLWNQLPSEAVESQSLGAFKRHLDSLLSESFYSTVDSVRSRSQNGAINPEGNQLSSRL